MKDVQAIVDEFQYASEANYGSFAYSSGYLGSMLMYALQELPKDRQASYLNDLKAQAEKMRSDVAMKTLSKSL